GVLGARACPRLPLSLCAFGRKGLPARAAEQLLILFVGELGGGNSHLAAEAFEQLLLSGVRRCLEFFVDLAIHESVYAADKKSRHAGNVADVLALCSASFESG